MASGIVSYKDRAERLARTVGRYRAEAKEKAQLTISAIATVAGGAAAGAAQAKAPLIPGTAVPTAVAAGGALVLIGLSGLVEELSDSVAALGAGMLAAEAAAATNKALAA